MRLRELEPGRYPVEKLPSPSLRAKTSTCENRFASPLFVSHNKSERSGVRIVGTSIAYDFYTKQGEVHSDVYDWQEFDRAKDPYSLKVCSVSMSSHHEYTRCSPKFFRQYQCNCACVLLVPSSVSGWNTQAPRHG